MTTSASCDASPRVPSPGHLHTTVMLAMGVPQSEWAETTHPGFGARVSLPADFFAYSPGTPKTSDVYTDAMWQKTGEILPFVAPGAMPTHRVGM